MSFPCRPECEREPANPSLKACMVHALCSILFCLVLLPAPSHAAPAGLPQESTLPNEIRLITQEWSGNDLGSLLLVSLAFRGGVLEEAGQERGLTRWLGETLTAAIRAQLRTPGELPPVVSLEMDSEYLALQMAVEQRVFGTQWDVISNLLRSEPKTWTLFAPPVEDLAEELMPLEQDGPFLVHLLLHSLLLGNSPLVNPPLGTPVSLRGLSPNRLPPWAARLLTPERLVVTVVHGPGFDRDALERSLASWPRPKTNEPLVEVSLPAPSHRLEALRPMPTTVPVIALGVAGPGAGDPNCAAFLVALAALGDSESGVLAQLKGTGVSDAIQVSWEAQRHQRVTIGSLHLAMDRPGDIVALHDRVLAVLEEIALTGFDPVLVARVQGPLGAALSQRRTDPVACLSWLTTWGIWEHTTAGRRFEQRVAAVTAAEATQALRRYLALDKLAIAGLSPNLPEDYYFPSDDPFWGTFRYRPRIDTSPPLDLLP